MTETNNVACAPSQSFRCPHEEALGPYLPTEGKWRLWSDWADAQADLSLRWAHTHFVGFVMSWLRFVIWLHPRARKFEPPPRHIPFTTFCRYKFWNFYGHILPTTFPSRAAVSYLQTYVHLVLVNGSGGLSLPRNCVSRLTDLPLHALISVDWAVKPQLNQSVNKSFLSDQFWKTIRILHGSEMRIENSILSHCLASRGFAEGWNFLSAPNTHVWSFV